MLKSELLKHIPQNPEKSIDIKCFRACGKEVLMVSGYTRTSFEYTSRSIHTVHFVWKDGYITWYQSGQWTRESIEYAGFPRIRSKLEPVKTFLKRAGDEESWDVGEFEEHIRNKKARDRERKKQKEIDAMARRKIPPLPCGFEKKVVAMAADIRSGETMNVKLFQRNTEGEAVERIFRVQKMKGENQQGGSPIRITEICNALEDEFGTKWNSWIYGQLSNAYGRRQRFWPTKRGAVGNLPKKYRIYDNLDSLGMSKAQISSLRAMDGKADPWAVLHRLRDHPEIEMVIKAGMTVMAADICDLIECIASEQLKNLQRIDRQTRRKIVKYNMGYAAAMMIWRHPEISDKWNSMISAIRSDYKFMLIEEIADHGLNMNHVFSLLDKTGGIDQTTMKLYTDYLRMAEARGSNIHDEIIYRNKRWRQFHDAYVEEENRRRAEIMARRNAEEARKRKQEYRRKYAGIWRDYRRNKEIFAWEKEGCRIVVPRSYADIIDEGQKQHNCVGSCGGRYMESMSQRKTWILFLRHTENPREPWYTIETDGKAVLQFYAAYDRQPDKETVQKILAEWMKQVRKNKAKVEKKEEEDRESQKLEEAGKAAGGCADQPVMQAAS